MTTQTTVRELIATSDHHGVWRLLPDRSAITFTVRSVWGLARVKGRFDDFSGDGQIAESSTDSGGAVFGRVDVHAASIRTGIGKRDAHLRSPDYFDVEKFPTLSVVVTSATLTGVDTVELRSRMTIRATTAPLALPATVTQLDEGAIRISTKTVVKRDDFELNHNPLGMIAAGAKVSADLVFARSG